MTQSTNPLFGPSDHILVRLSPPVVIPGSGQHFKVRFTITEDGELVLLASGYHPPKIDGWARTTRYVNFTGPKEVPVPPVLLQRALHSLQREAAALIVWATKFGDLAEGQLSRQFDTTD